MSNDNLKPTYRLTFEDAVDVWLRSWAGALQHEIAALYGVNQGRINEVLKGARHPGSMDVAADLRDSAA
jgi:hypothetical protein